MMATAAVAETCSW